MGWSCSGSECVVCSTIAFGNLISVSFLLLLLCAEINFVALSVDDGVRLITEQRTTGSGDGDRDGFGFVFKLIVSSVGNVSFSLINFCGLRSLSDLFGALGYDLRWACVKTWPIAPYGMPPPKIDEMNRPGRSGSVDCFSAERFSDAKNDDVLERSVWFSPNISRSVN